MVTNFEEYTKPLTADELKLVTVLMDGFKHRTINNPVLSRDIMPKVNGRLADYGVKQKLTEARLRKIVNYIRANSLQPLMATTKGYYLSDDPEEIARQIQSLRDRASGIENAARGLAEFLKPKPVVADGAPMTLFE